MTMPSEPLVKADALSALERAHEVLEGPRATDEDENVKARLMALYELVESMTNDPLPVEVYYE